ncbi:hypothetical protein J4E93_007797 [Alternaria ventricosa]|uniref:uncharacterized protein n=1 Tax=Alternaria ventricosa TaxID=1187951 RepID=UPI0020C4DDB6|nr:uncharacterized protein J4E93_007797 [Alternaria ventricosa]KAI4641699.1 hypothetical protein J4E93_007797 [Alternaria ventricosa]
MEPPTQAEKRDIAESFLSDEAAKEPEKHEVYFKHYEALTRGSPGDYAVRIGTPMYSSHAEVISFFNKLISNVMQTKADFDSLFANILAPEARDYAIQALVKASLMIDCASKQNSRKVGDYVPRTWGEKQSFANFVERCFPSSIQSRKIRQESQDALAQRGRLKAWKLKERYKVRLRPTNNLAEHLVFDPERRILHVFRQVGFLKAHLYRSRDEDIDIGFRKSLEKGTLPPQLLLEVLDSIQFLLFPNDGRSFKSLEKFTEKYGFDPKATYFERHIRTLPDDFEYKYLGDRLATLLRIVNHPPPANSIVAWFERHTSERNALTVAILGLFLTALLGFLSLLVGTVAVVYSILQYNVAVKALQSSPMSSST